jgi:dTMP kinase
MARAPFITFEGIEGSGKTTQIELLAEHLRSRGFSVLVTREPGGTPIGERLRDILLHPGTNAVPMTELFVLEAARSQIVAQVIAPSLADGTTVICDRFADSSLAYQGGGRGIAEGVVATVNALACAGTVPDRTIVLDMPVDEALARARQRTSTTDANRRFEDEDMRFHRAVAEAFRRLAAHEPTRVRLVDGQGEREQVFARVLGALAGVLPC